MTLHWGIASAGKISHDFVTAMATLPASEHKVMAVAAMDLTRAKQFAALHKIPDAVLGYEALAKHRKVDIVYVGSLNPQHLEIATLMLNNGKNVLCEKPLCLNYKQTKSLVDLARSKNLFLMEAVWSRFFPAYVHLRNLVTTGALGEIFSVDVHFGQPISDIKRLSTKELGGGTVLDLGIYVLQFSQMIFGCEPLKVVAAGHLNDDGVDQSMSCVMTYPNGGTATLSTHSKVALPCEARVTGTKGTTMLPMFWCPEKLQLPDGSWKEWPLPAAAHQFNFSNSCGLRYEAEECRRCIQKGLKESPIMPLNESLVLAKLEDQIRGQLGVKYPQDDVPFNF